MKRWYAFALLVAAVAALAGDRCDSELRPGGRPGEGGESHNQGRHRRPWSGLLSNYGAMYAQGIRLGLEYATNGTNRVNGHKVELTLVDDATDPAKAVSAAKDLIGQGYKIIAGSTSSGAGLAGSTALAGAEQDPLHRRWRPRRMLSRGSTGTGFRAGRQTIQDIMCARTLFSGTEVGRKVVTFAQDSAFGQSIAAGVDVGVRRQGTPDLADPRAAVGDRLHAVRGATEGCERRISRTSRGPARPRRRCTPRSSSRVSRCLTKVVSGIAERATWNLLGQSLQGLDLVSLYFPDASKNKVNYLAAGQDAAGAASRPTSSRRMASTTGADDRPRYRSAAETTSRR